MTVYWRCRILYSICQIAYTMRFLEFLNQAGIKEMKIRHAVVCDTNTPETFKRAEKKLFTNTINGKLPKILCLTALEVHSPPENELFFAFLMYTHTYFFPLQHKREPELFCAAFYESVVSFFLSTAFSTILGGNEAKTFLTRSGQQKENI